MKFLITVALALLAVALISVTADEEEIKEMIKKSAGECMKEMKLSKDPKELSPAEGKCLLRCMMEKLGAIEGGKLNKENMMKMAAKMTTDEEKLEELGEIADKCAKIENEDECEQAFEIHQCMKEGFKAQGLNCCHEMLQKLE